MAGSQFSLSEISATRIMASQKPGIATPSEATMLTILSTQPLGLIAATIPIGIPVSERQHQRNGHDQQRVRKGPRDRNRNLLTREQRLRQVALHRVSEP